MANPEVEKYVPELMTFINDLAGEYRIGMLNSWPLMTEKVQAFFTPDMMDKTDAVIPGWRKMSSYTDGITLVHTVSALTALMLRPEYRNATREQRSMMQWIILLHDLAKAKVNGIKDHTHGFRSAAMAGKLLSQFGFTVQDAYYDRIDEWYSLTYSAMTTHHDRGMDVQDNSKLPQIVAGIETLFGCHTAPALIVKTILFHYSFNVLQEWPVQSPLTDHEIGLYIDDNLLPLLRVMVNVDNDAWDFFEPETKERHRTETVILIDKVKHIIEGSKL
jgi:hypothetical protein